MDYVRRAKKRVGHEKYKRLHGAYRGYTLCGKELNMMWFYEGTDGDYSIKDITCPECLRKLRNNIINTERYK